MCSGRIKVTSPVTTKFYTQNTNRFLILRLSSPFLMLTFLSSTECQGGSSSVGTVRPSIRLRGRNQSSDSLTPLPYFSPKYSLRFLPYSYRPIRSIRPNPNRSNLLKTSELTNRRQDPTGCRREPH